MAARMELWKLIFVCFLKVCLLAIVWRSASVSGNVLHRCPKVSSGRMFIFGQKCYRFVSRNMDWNEAQGECQVTEGNLVHIKDEATQDFIYRTAKHTLAWDVNGMWIGAHDQRTPQQNVYEWVNGSRLQTGEQLSWNNWAKHQPSCGRWCTEECAQMRLDDNGLWHDYECSSSFTAFIYCCMYEMGPKITTTKRTTRRPATTTMKLPQTATTTTMKPATTTMKPPPPPTTTTTMKPATTTMKPTPPPPPTTTTTTMKPATTTMKPPPPPPPPPTTTIKPITTTKKPTTTTKKPTTTTREPTTTTREPTTTFRTEVPKSTPKRQQTGDSDGREILRTTTRGQDVSGLGTTQASYSSSSSTDSPKAALNGGEVAGLCIGFLCLLCLLAILFVVIRRRRKKAPEPPVSFSSDNRARASNHQTGENIWKPSNIHLEGAIGGHPDMTFGEESLKNNFNYSLRKGSKSELSDLDNDEDHYEELPYDKESRPISFKNDYLTPKSVRENIGFDTLVTEKVRSGDNSFYCAPGEAATSSDPTVCGMVLYQTPTVPARNTGQLSSPYPVNHGYESPRISPTPLTTEEDAELPNLSRERTAEDNFY